MVMTVEPGIYIPAGIARRAEALLEHRHPHRGRRGGARAQGCEVLTDGVPSDAGRHRSGHGAPDACMSAAWPQRFDIAIVGGGLVGASLAVALRGTRPAHRAGRGASRPTAARSPASTSAPPRWAMPAAACSRHWACGRRWRRMPRRSRASMCPMRGDSASRGWMRSELGLEALGYVVPNRVLGRELWAALQAAPAVTPFMPARLRVAAGRGRRVRAGCRAAAQAPCELRARLVVAADGAQSLVRKAAGLSATVDDYGQVAIVASLRTDQRQRWHGL